MDNTFCEYCGAALAVHSRYCVQCGKAQSVQSPSAEPPAAAVHEVGARELPADAPGPAPQDQTVTSGSRRVWLFVLGLIAVAAAFVAGFAANGSTTPSKTSSAPLSSSPAPANRRADATFRTPDDLNALAFGFGSVWALTNGGHAEVVRYDAASNRQEGKAIPVLSYARSMVAAPSGLWVASAPRIQRVDPATGAAGEPIDVDVQIDGGLAAADGVIWDVDYAAKLGTNIGNGDGSATTIDPVSGTIVGTPATLPACPRAGAAGDGALYLLYDQCGGFSGLGRVGKGDLAETANSVDIGGAATMAFANGVLWVTHAEDGTVTPIDAGSLRSLGRPIYVGNNPAGIAVDAGSLWITLFGDDQVVQVDIRRRTVVNRFAVGADPDLIAAGDGHVWAYNQGDRTISRIDP